MIDVKKNEIHFERAARSYYFAVTGRLDWSEIPPKDRARFRSELEQAAKRLDSEISQQAARELWIEAMGRQSQQEWRF